MAAGDQSGWIVLMYAATPAAWGQDMEVPDCILYLTRLMSPGVVEIGEDKNAAKISIPGALISG